MKDMDIAVRRIRKAIEADQKIRIIGDYDQDGIAATALFMTGLRELGARVDYRIPHRVHDGYGINVSHVARAQEDGISLLLTCDNGISALEAAEAAVECGIDLIITDHHQPPEVLPRALAILNPHRADCNYPTKNLAGAGVALKLCEGLWSGESHSRFPAILFAYAAMGTVCDIMDLVDENRTLVLRGLAILNRSPSPGIRAMKEEAGIRGSLDVYTLGFVIGPMMNAAGRLDDAAKGVELLLQTDPLAVVKLARELRELNTKRQELTEEALARTLEKVSEPVPSLLVVQTECHESLLGIVAGKMRDRYHRPVYVMTASREPGIWKGSARSISSYNMIEHLHAVEPHLIRYGGHAMAAGFSLRETELDRFHRALLASWNPVPEDLQKTLVIDYPIDLQYVTPLLVGELERLEPFGKGNPKPHFASRQVELSGIKVIGKNRNTLRYRFRRGAREYTGIQFRNAEKTLEYLYRQYGRKIEAIFSEQGEGIPVSIVYTPQMNEYGGARFLQLVVEDIR